MEPLRWFHAGNGCWNELESIFLVITSAGTLVLRAGGVEVVAQREAYRLLVAVVVLSCLTDGVVGGDFVPHRVENVVGKECCRKLALPEGLL